MDMDTAIAELERARLPASALGRLAALRCESGVEVALHDRDLWVQWRRGSELVPHTLLPVSGCQLYGRCGAGWYRWGTAIPAFDVPESLRFRPLWQVIFPAQVAPILAKCFSPELDAFQLVDDSQFRPTTAIECPLEAFLKWAETVPSCALSKYRGVFKGGSLLAVGKDLPWVQSAERFWGRSVLAPIGFCPAPHLSEADLRRGLAVAETDLLILRHGRIETIEKNLFCYLTHAVLRLAHAEEAS
jgi:hypothetical protein